MIPALQDKSIHRRNQILSGHIGETAWEGGKSAQPRME